MPRSCRIDLKNAPSVPSGDKGLARIERANPKTGQTSSLATTAEELLLRQTRRRSHT